MMNPNTCFWNLSAWRPWRLGGLFLLVIAIAAFPAHAAGISLKVMTFNLRYASNTPPNEWKARRPVMKNLILKYAPDLIGTQEGLYGQLKDMAADLLDYAWIGEGRNGGSKGEFMAIFYRRDRFEPMAYGHFWLSDTPDAVSSTSWGNKLPRMVTWVQFKERASGMEFIHWNTHFDHESQPARERSAQLLIERIRAQPVPRPSVVTGDFNQAQSNIVHQTLLAVAEGQVNLTDTWEKAAKRTNEGISTFHGYREVDRGGVHIDWILTSPEFKSIRSEVVTFEENGQRPSDHYPVMSELTLSQ